jgi:holo-[acyl-carrier protein] synthase
MQVYCGTDIIEVDRIEEAINNTKGFRENIYTKNEIDCCDSIRCQMKYQRYAGRFAAKEAIYKAMSKILVENNLNMSFLDVEIENVSELKNRPRAIILNEDIAKMCELKKVDIDVTISHIKENAIAMAVVKVND